jgi:hypothetical protein
MDALQSWKRDSFLFFESNDDSKRRQYGADSSIARQKSQSVENAFATAIGKDAVYELERIRKKEDDCFSRFGDMAPVVPFCAN